MAKRISSFERTSTVAKELLMGEFRRTWVTRLEKPQRGRSVLPFMNKTNGLLSTVFLINSIASLSSFTSFTLISKLGRLVEEYVAAAPARLLNLKMERFTGNFSNEIIEEGRQFGFTPGLKQAMGILEKISDIEREIARTQKNKGKVSAFFSFH